MSKLNLLKWIYDLGYHKAEDRYYYALMQLVQQRSTSNPSLYKMANETDKEWEKRKNNEAKLFYELRILIDSVFHPQEYVETTPKDRFMP